MQLITGLRLVGAIALVLLVWGNVDRLEVKADLKALERSNARCAEAAGSASTPIAGCSPEVAAVIRAARNADACEAALAEGALYSIHLTCGAQVKYVTAQRDTARDELAETRRQLAQSGAATAQAVARAEARATITADRKAQNDRTIEAAPRNGDGRVHCDADCMRRLAGEAEGGTSRP